jgi:hypothetical protein
MKILDFDGMQRKKENAEKQKQLTSYQNEIFFDNIGTKKTTGRNIKKTKYKIDTKELFFENKTVKKRKFFVLLNSKRKLKVILITENPTQAIKKMDKLNG